MKLIKHFENFNTNDVITLYHGTCVNNAKNLIKHGWKPNSNSYGSNLGQSKYLYLTSMSEDAMWFANQKDCNTIINVIDIPIDCLMFDPEDGDGDIYDYDIKKAIKKINSGYPLPIKFSLIKPLDKSHFIIRNS